MKNNAGKGILTNLMKPTKEYDRGYEIMQAEPTEEGLLALHEKLGEPLSELLKLRKFQHLDTVVTAISSESEVQ